VKIFISVLILMVCKSSFAGGETPNGKWVKIYETTEQAFDFYGYTRLYDRHSRGLDKNPPADLDYAIVTTSEYEFITDQWCPDAYRFQTTKSAKVCTEQPEKNSNDAKPSCSWFEKGLISNPCPPN